MIDNEKIIQEATEAVEKGLPCAFLVKPLLEVAKNQKLEIEILIRKKEALRDEIAEQQAEIERLEGEKEGLLFSVKSLSGLANSIKSEAYREFAEILRTTNSTVENVLNKLLSNDMGRYDHYTDSFVKEPTESNE